MCQCTSDVAPGKPWTVKTPVGYIEATSHADATKLTQLVMRLRDAEAPGEVSVVSAPGLGLPSSESTSFLRLMRLIDLAPDPSDGSAYAQYMQTLRHLLPAGSLDLT